MSEAHLHQLSVALMQRGWKIIAQSTFTWEIRRNPEHPPLLIDFAEFGGMGEDIPLSESYACFVRGQNISLYFSRVNRSRDRWQTELAAFVAALDGIATN